MNEVHVICSMISMVSPFIALTGYRRDEEWLRAAGFDDHLSKSLSTARLRRALADLDERQSGG